MTKAGLYPDRIGDYAITGLIAEGGMSLVLAGVDEAGHTVAIKLAEVHDERGRERFRREIEACRRLSHPGIIRILAVGEHLGRPWYAMDHHGEVTLRELLECNGPGVANELPALIGAIQRREIFALPPDRRRPLPRSVVVELVLAVGEAVAHAHERGLIHRDLKPENVLLRPSGRPVVVDFGLVADRAGGRRLTQTSRVVGTVGYLAPEQFVDRREVDERVDVYAMGMILRELLTGVGPDDEPGARRGSVSSHTSARLSRDPGDRPLDRQLGLVLHRATHPDPRRRYRSMPAFLADLGRIQRGEPVLARPDPLWLRLVDRIRRRGALIGTLVVIAVLVAVLVLALAVRWRLRDLAWAEWSERHRLDRPVEVARMDALTGSWRLVEGGVVPIGEGGALAAPGHHGPHLRLHARFTGDGAGGGGLFAAAANDPRDGYHLRLSGGTARLERRGRLLAAVTCSPGPGSHDLRWQIDVTGHRIELDGKLLIAARDEAPLTGGRCGLHSSDGRWRWSVFAVRPASAHGGADPATELHRLASLAADLEPERRAVFASAVAEAIAAGDRPAVAVAGARAQRVIGLPGGEELLAAVAADRRDLAWRQEAVLSGWAGPGAAVRLAALQTDWADPEARDQLALWLVRAADELGSAEPLHRARRWSAQAPPGAAAATAGALAGFQRLRWDARLRLGELDAALAAGAQPWLGRAVAWAWWAHAVADHHRVDPALPVHPLLLARLQRRAAAVAGSPAADDALSDLVTGRTPGSRFDPARVRDPGALVAADRELIDLIAREEVPAPTAWDLPAAAALRAPLLARLRGEGDWDAVATAASRSGIAPWDLPWHRLLLSALALDGDRATSRAALLALGEVDLDTYAGGLLHRVATDAAIDPGVVARAGAQMRPVVAALWDAAAPRSQVSAPAWHPSRPLLELALALRAQRSGDPVEARARLEALSRQRDWPEGVAAAVLLERLESEDD